MSSIDIKGVVDAFVAVITDNVPDPLLSDDDPDTKRDAGKFVETEKPHRKAKTPYVLVTCERITPAFAEAGSTDEDFYYRFEVRIRVASGQGGYVGGTRYAGIELLHELASDIANQIRANDTSTSGFKIIRKDEAGGYVWDTVNENHAMIQYYIGEVIKSS